MSTQPTTSILRAVRPQNGVSTESTPPPTQQVGKSVSSEPTIIGLASDIMVHAQAIQHFLETKGYPQPGLHKDAPLQFPTDLEIQGARMALIEASKMIYDLAVGPTNSITWSSLSTKCEVVVLRAINEYNFVDAVPLHGEASFAEIAERTKLPEDFVTRIIRYAATSHIFREPREGYVIHTAASRALLEDKLMRSLVSCCADEGLTVAAKVNEAVDKWGHSGKRYETAFNLAFDVPDLDMFGFWEKPEQQWRKQRFAECMQYRARNEEAATFAGNEADPVLNGSFDWNAVDLVVDIGGGLGHIAAKIATHYPNPKFLIQDLPSVVEQGKAYIDTLEVSTKSRISFMEHNFWDAQTVEADVYFLRLILHDWSDESCAKIVKAIIPKMKWSSKIVICDAVLPNANTVPKVVEKLQRTMDLSMMMLLGGKERTGKDWELLLKAIDHRLKIVKVSVPPGSQLGLIEVMLDLPHLRGKL